MITIVTPTKNRLALLREAVASVAAQTFADWEHLVVDDGSDDGSDAYLQQCAIDDPRLRYIRREGERAGANVCRNIGLREARGEFLVFLDSDDLLRPGCLARRLEIMTRNQDLDFASFNSDRFVEVPGDLGVLAAEYPSGDFLLRFLSFDTPWIITGPIWRTSYLRQLGGMDEALPSWQDIDLHIRALAAGARYLCYPEYDNDIRWQFEHTKVSVRQRRSLEHLRAAVQTVAKFEAVVRQGPGMDWCRRRAICGLYFLISEMMVDAGSMHDARECWRETRRRGLSRRGLHWVGSVLLLMLRFGFPRRSLVERSINKWKGLVRFRVNADLIES